MTTNTAPKTKRNATLAVASFMFSVLSTMIALLFGGVASAHEGDFLPPLEEGTYSAPADTGGGMPMALIAGGVILVAVIASAVIVLKGRKAD